MTSKKVGSMPLGRLSTSGSFCNIRSATKFYTLSLIATITLSLLSHSHRQNVLGALFTNAQYSSSAICDSSKLIRCQQDVIRDMQLIGSNTLGQYSLSGPPYSPNSPSSSGSLLNSKLIGSTTCRTIRSNLDCLLMTTPACYDQGIQTAQNTDIILRAKRFLEQNNCNEPDITWQTSFCYRSAEIRNCEDRYGFTSSFSSNINNNLLTSNNITTCLAYQAFKFCVDSHLRLNCKVHEMDMANEYLIDRASDLAWRCPHNITNSDLTARYLNPYQLNSQQVLSPIGPAAYGGSSSGSGYNSGYNSGYEPQRVIMPSYVGANTPNLFSQSSQPFREQPWERFRPVDDITRNGISRFPGSVIGLTGSEYANPFGVDQDLLSDCPIKAKPYAMECENTLRNQQALARDSRDGNELQRRICCSLYQYRDCISRVVLDRCADSSPTAVELLMGSRRREMTLTCRSFDKDICSGSMRIPSLNWPILFGIGILTSFMTFKQQQLGFF